LIKVLVLSVVFLLALVPYVIAPSTAVAAPAEPIYYDLCYVQDANLVQFTVPCNAHIIYKTDDNGDRIAVLNYQDKAQLPPEAALPDKMYQSVFHVDCDCLFDGDYMQTITPNGHYESHGPINNN
jgi:hypothetical protein